MKHCTQCGHELTIANAHEHHMGAPAKYTHAHGDLHTSWGSHLPVIDDDEEDNE